jgi:cytosine/adenosine deaminase-related metal-dependent hydrolase
MSTTATIPALTPVEGYRLWAGTYDREPNPMLSLECRILEPLLPPVQGLDVVDLGCGTGRWLDFLKGSGTRSLIGVDFSTEMLAQARSKLSSSAKIIHADCASLPLAPASADLILCTFVLSYLSDLRSFLRAVSEILRPGGSLFITDLHPETASAFNWRRGANTYQQFREIQTHPRSMDSVLGLCRENNLEVAVSLEPKFGREERIIFERNGKGDYFDRIRNFPPIYILQLCSPAVPRFYASRNVECETTTILRNARVALGPDDSEAAECVISGGAIRLLDSHDKSQRHSPASCSTSIDLSGYLLLPGLVNAHDHLEFALFPRLGKGAYNNFLEWVHDIHDPSSSPIAEHRRVPRAVRLCWGGIRNLLCGVTTVCHHNPYEPEVFTNDFPVRVLADYGWAHSLAMDSDAVLKKAATPTGQPFFLHLGEGIDGASADEIFALHRARALDSDTVIVHGLGMDSNGRSLFRASKAGLVWCPTSNLFLFGKTFSSAEIRRFPYVALGSDSPLTAAGDFLDEVNCAYRALRAAPSDLFNCVTRQASHMLRLQNGEGSFRVGAVADLIAVRDTGHTPAETLVDLSFRDVDLVLLAGRLQLASTEMKDRLPDGLFEGLQPLSIEGNVRWIRAPLDRLFAETAPHLGNELRLGGKQVRLGN